MIAKAASKLWSGALELYARAQAWALDDEAQARELAATKEALATMRCRAFNEAAALDRARAFLGFACDEGLLELHGDDENCPQDDTCECADAREFNEIMRGYRADLNTTRRDG